MLPFEASAALTVVYTILILVDLIGNTLVCYIVIRHRSMRTPMNFLLVNLAVADILVALFLSPQYVFRSSFVHPDGAAGDYVCKFLTGGFLTWVGGAASAYTLVTIAVERYFAVVRSGLQRRQITKAKLKGIIISCWLYALAVELPPVIVMRYNAKEDLCYEAWPSENYPKVYTVMTFLLDFAIPSVIMSYLHAQTIRTLRKETKTSKRSVGAEATQVSALKAKKRVTIMVVIVTVVYSVCWLPNVTSYLLAYYHPDFRYGSLLYHTAVLFVCVNSCANPFIYSIQNRRFWKYVKVTFSWMKVRSYVRYRIRGITFKSPRTDSTIELQNN